MHLFRSKLSIEAKITFSRFKYILMTAIIGSASYLIPKDPLKDLAVTGMLILIIIFCGAIYIALKRYFSPDRKIYKYEEEIEEHLNQLSIGTTYLQMGGYDGKKGS
jgi:hypothetical protein